MGSFQIAYFASTRRGLLPSACQECTDNLEDFRCYFETEIQNPEQFKLKLCTLVFLSAMYILYCCTILNETHMYSDDTPVQRDKLQLMPSYLMQCTIFQ